MAEHVPTSPAAGNLPFRFAGITIEEAPVTAIYLVQPHRDEARAVSDRLQETTFLTLPPPGESRIAEHATCLWAGRSRWMVLDAVPGALAGAAITDVSDGWAVLDIAGEGVSEVMARLCPLDLRAHIFPPGRVALSLLGHADAIVLRRDGAAFRVLVWRSLVAHVLEELAVAVRRVAARAAV